MFELIMRVFRNDLIAKSTYEMVLRCENDAFFEKFKPGQFINVKIPNAPNLFLRRPISVSGVNVKEKLITIQYIVVGEGTQSLSKAKKDDVVTILGPVGNGFALKKSYKKAFLLGGGIGIAPLYSIVQSTNKIEFSAFLGYKSKEYVYGFERFTNTCKSATLYTDDGSFGKPGFAISGMVEAIAQERPDVIFSCGPKPMFVALQKALKGLNIECFVSLEERMGCAVGACLVCACKIKTADSFQNKRVCVDGPVFEISEVEFE